MKSDIILAGVGGQGILATAAAVGMAAFEKSSLLKTSRSSWNESAWRCRAVSFTHFRDRNYKQFNFRNQCG